MKQGLVVSLILVTSLMLAACDVSTPEVEPTEQPPGEVTDAVPEATPETAEAGFLVEEADFTGFVFSAEWAEQEGFYRMGGESFWTPTRDDVLALEGSLEDAIQPYAEAQGYADLGQRLPDYLRQYIGVAADGQQLIYAALFCDAYGLDWQKVLILGYFEDGGVCLIDVSYDPENDVFPWISIHGEA